MGTLTLTWTIDVQIREQPKTLGYKPTRHRQGDYKNESEYRFFNDFCKYKLVSIKQIRSFALNI